MVELHLVVIMVIIYCDVSLYAHYQSEVFLYLSGFRMAFVETPPSEVTSADIFMVNFTLHAEDRFFDWGVRNDTGYADYYGPVFNGFR